MGSKKKHNRKNKHDSLFDNLEILRSITNSSATSKEKIIFDATKYIEELKEKVERLSHEEYCGTGTGTGTNSTSCSNSLPMVRVETLEEGGFLIDVAAENDRPGLLVWILEAFHELGLDVMDARVSCSDTFQFQAVGGGGGGDKEEVGREDSTSSMLDAEMVKQAVHQAINNWINATATSTTTSLDDDHNDDD
ncbi:hypothetical protein LINPERHAP1_LOCUS12024 [Linum perenne]